MRISNYVSINNRSAISRSLAINQKKNVWIVRMTPGERVAFNADVKTKGKVPIKPWTKMSEHEKEDFEVKFDISGVM